jgi:multiple sugar transport system substrate-binding protein
MKQEQMTRRKIFGLGAALSTGALAATACGPAQTRQQTQPEAAAPATGAATVTGRLQVVQVLDFHPDHNAFIRRTIQEFATQKNWQLDLSDLAGFLGGTDIYQKLQAQKTAGQPVDLIFHGLSARQLALFDLTRDATPLVNQAVQRWGQPYSSARAGHVVDNKWVGLPFYDRVGGYFAREDRVREAGINPATAFETWQDALETSRRISNPAQNFYGWGMTVNRSGDGESLVWNVIWSWGGALADQTGQVVTLNTPQTVDAIRWLTDIYMNPENRNIVPVGVNAWNDMGNNEAWLAGTIGFTSNAGTLYAKSVVDNNPVAEHTMYVQQPFGPPRQRLQGSGGHYFYFMNGSRNFDAAAELAMHLLSDEVQQTLWRTSTGYVVPAYQRRWDHPLIRDNRISAAFRPVSFNEPPFPGVSWRGPLSEAAEAVSTQNVVTDMMGTILAGTPVEQAVRDAHNRAVSIYQAFGFRGR